MNEMPEIFNEITRTARKPHVCCECFRPIVPKSKYIHITGRWDGEFSEYRQCVKCATAFKQAMTKLSDLGLMADEGPGIGDLTAWLDEFTESDGSNTLASELGIKL